mgnify:CR=1 FL=1
MTFIEFFYIGYNYLYRTFTSNGKTYYVDFGNIKETEAYKTGDMDKALEELINKALEEVDERKAEDRLEKLLENKYRTLKDDPQWRLKLLRFALGRGYSYEESIKTQLVTHSRYHNHRQLCLCRA